MDSGDGEGCGWWFWNTLRLMFGSMALISEHSTSDGNSIKHTMHSKSAKGLT